MTILSRCQRYDFKRISVDTISERLYELLQKEGADAKEDAIRYIARAADGAMRDALSLLDQCIAFYPGQKLTYDAVLDVLGAVDTEVFGELLDMVLAQDVAGAMAMVERLVADGRELGQFALDFVWYFRNLLLLKCADETAFMLDMSSENKKSLREKAGRMDTETLIRYIRIFSELSGQLKYSSQKRVLLEVALIKLCRPQMEQTQDALLDRIRLLEEKIEEGDFGGGAQQKVVYVSEEAHEEVKEKPELPKAVPEDVRVVVKDFRRLTNEVSIMLKNYLKSARLSVGTNGQLLIVMPDTVSAGVVGTQEHRQELESIISEKLGKKIEIEVRQAESGRRFEDCYIDLEKIICTDIIVEEEE